ncbi:ADP-L-glycero-D-manno-heptose-6-epimerase [Clostridia bacterium]|nr:ADP-L-glycero-D-manno-heptose-6-epimerase [Clostridia bacterium]
MSVVLTGGAGFIGSCVMRMLLDSGVGDVIVVDNIASTDKWKNLVGKRYSEYVHKDIFIRQLSDYKDVTCVVHMGACSSTTESDFAYLHRNNFEYSKTLWRYCAGNGIPFIYASSAATYGDGSQGFDDEANISILRPLNGYAYSKQLFDLWTLEQTVAPPQHVGLKFFNVYGPNEYFKGGMASMVFHGFNQIQESGAAKLFKSQRHDYADGEQLRDFVYVKDICKVVKFFIEHLEISGLFNVGTGRAQSFNALINGTFTALGKPANIEYVDMPQSLRGKYQYYTQATIGKLRSVGYTEPFYSVEDGTRDYVREHLEKGYLTF